MNSDRGSRRLDWFICHSQLDVCPSMKRRKDDHVYTDRCIYLITICCSERHQLFGTLEDADSDHAVPWIQPSQLGTKVIEHWSNISLEQPLIKNMAFQLMPDHVHGILFVTAPLPRHIGHYVSRFKAKCTTSMRNMSSYCETKSRTSSLWEPGYNDRILINKGQLQNWAKYLHDNPRRLWIKRNHPEWFTARQGINIGSTPVTCMGNLSLLQYPYKVAVQCSRKMTEQDIEAACQRFLSMAHDGAVLVSPCISPGEKEVMRRAFITELPLIILLENGFTPMQKPSGRQFDACASGQLLLVAPWEHHNDRRTITRQQCIELNKLAKEITEYETASRNTITSH